MEMTVNHVGDMLFESTVSGFTLKGDAPASMFGDNRAPTPPEYFLFSIGLCVGMFVTFHCEKSGINTEGLSVKVNCEVLRNPERFEKATITIRLPNAQYEEHKEEIIKAAKDGFVTATMSASPKLEFELQK